MRGAKPFASLEAHIERSDVLRDGERIIIACSGGVDSVCLAGLLSRVAEHRRLTLTLAYINHGRRRSAWQDECVVARIAATFAIPLRVHQLEAVGDDEVALRDARYAALAEIARSEGAGAIVTAHHAQDQTETMLLALCRGTGLDGLTGISPRRTLGEGIDIVRPLLEIDGETLLDYVQTRALPYAVDPTNSSLDYRRNAVRASLDTLRPLFDGLDRAFARTAGIVRAERSGAGRAQIRRRVRAVLARERALRDVPFDQVDAAARSIERGGGGLFSMRSGVALRISRGDIVGVERT